MLIIQFSNMSPSCSSDNEGQQVNECSERQQETNTNTNRNNNSVRLRLPMRPIECQQTQITGDAAARNNNATAYARHEWICALLQVALDVANDPMLEDGVDSGLVGSEIGEVNNEGLRQ